MQERQRPDDRSADAMLQRQCNDPLLRRSAGQHNPLIAARQNR